MKMDRTFKIGDVTFNLQKIPPLDGFEICELFRVAVSRPEVLMQLAKDSDSDEQAAKRVVMGLLMSVSREHVKQLRGEMFKYVTFTTLEQKQPLPLEGVEDMAFGALDPLAIYEVLGRAIAVNFTEYFKGLMTRLGINLSAVLEQKKQDTQT